MPVYRYVEEKSLIALLATKRLAGVAPGESLEHVTYMPLPSTNKAASSGFETQRRCLQKSKTGISVASERTYVFQFF